MMNLILNIYTALIRKPRNDSHKSLGGICPKCRIEKHIESKKHTDEEAIKIIHDFFCLLYTSPSPRDRG